VEPGSALGFRLWARGEPAGSHRRHRDVFAFQTTRSRTGHEALAHDAGLIFGVATCAWVFSACSPCSRGCWNRRRRSSHCQRASRRTSRIASFQRSCPAQPLQQARDQRQELSLYSSADNLLLARSRRGIPHRSGSRRHSGTVCQRAHPPAVREASHLQPFANPRVTNTKPTISTATSASFASVIRCG